MGRVWIRMNKTGRLVCLSEIDAMLLVETGEATLYRAKESAVASPPENAMASKPIGKVRG